jgi:Domain of unknown function (DUF4296)
MIRVSIIALFLFFSCKQKTRVPDTVLPIDRMEKVLRDMLLADEFYNQKQADSATMDSFSRTNLYKAVFTGHKTNKDEFRKSLNFYQSHPDLLKIILDSAHSKANKQPPLRPEIPLKTKRALKK